LGGEVLANWSQAERALREAATQGADLCLLPEMWPSSFCAQVDRELLDQTAVALARTAELSRELGLLIGGSAYGGSDPERPSNRFHLFQDGQEIYSYEKGHLFSPTAEHLSFRAGEAPPRVAQTRFGPMHGVVCYDLRFPAWVRPATRSGSRVMLVVAQWPSERASHWRALVQGRAVEGQCFVVACNRSGSATIGRRQLQLDFPGNSLVVDPDGNVLAQGTPEATCVFADLDLEQATRARRAVPVWKDERDA